MAHGRNKDEYVCTSLKRRWLITAKSREGTPWSRRLQRIRALTPVNRVNWNSNTQRGLPLSHCIIFSLKYKIKLRRMMASSCVSCCVVNSDLRLNHEYVLVCVSSHVADFQCSKFNDPPLQNVTQISATLELQVAYFDTSPSLSYSAATLTHNPLTLSGSASVRRWSHPHHNTERIGGGSVHWVVAYITSAGVNHPQQEWKLPPRQKPNPPPTHTHTHPTPTPTQEVFCYRRLLHFLYFVLCDTWKDTCICALKQ